MQNKYFLIKIFLAILLFSGLAWWQFSNWEKSSGKLSLPDFEMPEVKLSSQQGEIEEKEFSSKDGVLKLTYGSDWMEVQISEDLNKELLKENAELLFFAQKFDLGKSFFAYLVVQKVVFEKEPTIDEAVEFLKGSEATGEREIISSEKNENQALLFSRIKKDGQILLVSRGKLLKNKNEIYWVDVLCQESNFEQIKDDTEKILQSTQVVE